MKIYYIVQITYLSDFWLIDLDINPQQHEYSNYDYILNV